jgi:hypothetical protein
MPKEPLSNNTVIVVRFSKHFGRVHWVYAVGKDSKDWNSMLDPDNDMAHGIWDTIDKLRNALAGWGAKQITKTSRNFKINSFDWDMIETWQVDNSKLVKPWEVADAFDYNDNGSLIDGFIERVDLPQEA